jgi:polysaccharide pyruvyl transferase WcaK-like protein
MKQEHTYLVLAGAAPDTANHGVTALAQSAVLGLAERGIDHFSIFDNGVGLRQETPAGWSSGPRIDLVGFRPGRRIYETSNMHNARLRQMFGLPAMAVSAISNAAAVIDVSGGDSFTDLYGPARFEQITLPKLMAIDCGTPLILLPQTYGPFRHERSRRIARTILTRSSLAFARDALSFQNMKALLGDAFDPNRHRLGVDLAFGLPRLDGADVADNRPVGLNVSGLLWNRAAASGQFGLAADYRQVMIGIANMIMGRSDKDILLVPHVTPRGGESDLIASEALLEMLPAETRSRVRIARQASTPAELKGVVASCCWFAGARMHATIAALSTCTPVANMAYSDKALGVFDTCGAAGEVFDLRKLSTEAMTEELFGSFWTRGNQVKILKGQMPFVSRRWAYQMDAIAGFVKSSGTARGRIYA